MFIELIYHSGAQIVDWGRKKFPPSNEIIRLFATIVFLIYGWTTFAFFLKLPSWLFILTPAEIAITTAYILTSDLFESLLVLVIFVAAGLLLPARWLHDDFAVRGGLILYITTFWTCVFTLNSLISWPSRSELVLMVLGFLASMGVMMFLVKKHTCVGRLMRTINERMIIFLYVWIPLSLLALLVVVARTLGRILESG